MLKSPIESAQNLADLLSDALTYWDRAHGTGNELRSTLRRFSLLDTLLAYRAAKTAAAAPVIDSGDFTPVDRGETSPGFYTTELWHGGVLLVSSVTAKGDYLSRFDNDRTAFKEHGFIWDPA